MKTTESNNDTGRLKNVMCVSSLNLSFRGKLGISLRRSEVIEIPRIPSPSTQEEETPALKEPPSKLSCEETKHPTTCKYYNNTMQGTCKNATVLAKQEEPLPYDEVTIIRANSPDTDDSAKSGGFIGSKGYLGKPKRTMRNIKIKVDTRNSMPPIKTIPLVPKDNISISEVIKLGQTLKAAEPPKNGINVAVRQQYYDRWARAKRGRPMLRYKQDAIEAEDVSRALTKYREQKRKQKEEQQRLDLEKNGPREITPSQYLFDNHSITDQLNKEWEPKTSIETYGDLGSDEENDEGIKVQINISTNNDSDYQYSVKEDRRKGGKGGKSNSAHYRSPTHAVLQPFLYDVKPQTPPVSYTSSIDRYHGRADNKDHSSSMDKMQGKSENRDLVIISPPVVEPETESMLDLNVPIGKKYRLFSYPIRRRQEGQTDAQVQRVQDKENIQFDKVPLILSKKSPVLEEKDNTSPDKRHRKLEESLYKMRMKTDDGPTSFGFEPSDLEVRSRSACNVYNYSPLGIFNSPGKLFLNYNNTSPFGTNMNDYAEPRYRLSVKNKATNNNKLSHPGKWDNAGGRDTYPSELQPIVSPMMIRGESANTT